MNQTKTYYAPLKPDGMRVLAVYIMLDNRQIVNYERINSMFEISYMTFMRTIASIRDALDNFEVKSNEKLIFNKRKDSYELIKL